MHFTWKPGISKLGHPPPKLPHKHQALALALHYYTAACEHKTLCEIFGVPPSTFEIALRKAEVAPSGYLQE
ncbi:hypothetical protein H257_18576, partial [Aphanomyces astaci]